ncbi:MAG: hypothetical protein PHE96_07865 [Methylococcales bacterium]|nr:hypothetical protein [Methylococcales bacterium]
MITTVRQKLKELGKINCEHNSLSFQEKGKGVKLTPSSNGEAIKIRVDDQAKNNGLPGLITNSARCDCLYFYQQPSRRHVFIVELKGNNYPQALKQLEATITHENYQALLKTANPEKKWAVAIVSNKANINRPRVDEWEDLHNHRLKPIRISEDKTYELTQLIPSK